MRCLHEFCVFVCVFCKFDESNCKRQWDDEILVEGGSIGFIWKSRVRESRFLNWTMARDQWRQQWYNARWMGTWDNKQSLTQKVSPFPTPYQSYLSPKKWMISCLFLSSFSTLFERFLIIIGFVSQPKFNQKIKHFKLPRQTCPRLPSPTKRL